MLASLMGFKDESFEKAQKVNSNTQLYKQAGNSICVPVLEKIIYELLKDSEYYDKNNQSDERFENRHIQ